MSFATHSAADFVAKSEREMKALAPAELIELVSKQGGEIVKRGHEIAKQEHEIVNLRRQVAWFQRQSERPGEPRATHEICRLG